VDYRRFRLKRDPVVRAVRLNKAFWLGRAVYAVDDVSLDIEEGQYVYIRGPSGSGKSTLLSLLAGFDRPTSGEVILDGIPLSRLSERDLTMVRRRKVGAVYQFFNLLPGLTALENVIMALRVAGAPKRYAARRADELLDRVGLGGRKNHLPSQLSGGEQQRVAIVRALANEPKVLLADEPTANLDSRTSSEFRDFLRELNRDVGQTCIVVSHDDAFERDAHRVIELRDGRVIGERGGGAGR